MTGRDFRSEIENGQKHHALSDCRAQVEYLVNARNALMPQPMARMLPSPETSFSSVEVQVGQVFRRELPSPETSFSSVGVRLEQILTRQLSGPEDPFLSTDIIDDQQVLRSTATSLDDFEETLSEHEAFLEILTASQEARREDETEDSVIIKPSVATILLSPQTSFSSAGGDDIEALRSAGSSLLEPSSSDREALPGMFVPCNVSTSMNARTGYAGTYHDCSDAKFHFSLSKWLQSPRCSLQSYQVSTEQQSETTGRASEDSQATSHT